MEFKLFHTVRPLPSLMNKQFTNNLQASVFCFRMKWGCWTFLLPSWCEEHQLIFPSPLPGKGFIQSSKTLSERYSWNNTFFFFSFEGEVMLISNWRVINWKNINLWLFIVSVCSLSANAAQAAEAALLWWQEANTNQAATAGTGTTAGSPRWAFLPPLPQS